jgi:hypothetical protein
MTSRLQITVALAFCVACLEGCGYKDLPSTPKLQVRGSIRDVGGSIFVERAGIGDDSAIVRVNGDLFRPVGDGTGAYVGSFSPSLTADASVYLEVSSGESSLIGAGWMPAAPVITAPAEWTSYGAGQDVEVTFDPQVSLTVGLQKVGTSAA